MPIFDDEDDAYNPGEPPRRAEKGRGGKGRGGSRGGRGKPNRDHSWDVDNDDPDDRDMVPDEMTTVRCTRCRKWIFEETECCPYCKHFQMEDERNRKPLWYVLTTLILVGLMGGFGLLYMMGWFIWR